tara:strand:- start:4586 stop:4750 length:165 start_codon:yes stop_codon:yes gene_type:complete
MKLDSHQWKLVFSAVRKQQQKEAVSSGWYKEYDEILNRIHPLAYEETYSDEPKK